MKLQNGYSYLTWPSGFAGESKASKVSKVCKEHKVFKEKGANRGERGETGAHPWKAQIISPPLDISQIESPVVDAPPPKYNGEVIAVWAHLI